MTGGPNPMQCPQNHSVIAGLDPAIHHVCMTHAKRWMRGSSPRMTHERSTPPASFDLDLRIVDDLGPSRALGLDARAEFLRRIGHRREAERLQLLLDVGKRH